MVVAAGGNSTNGGGTASSGSPSSSLTLSKGAIFSADTSHIILAPGTQRVLIPNSWLSLYSCVFFFCHYFLFFSLFLTQYISISSSSCTIAPLFLFLSHVLHFLSFHILLVSNSLLLLRHFLLFVIPPSSNSSSFSSMFFHMSCFSCLSSSCLSYLFILLFCCFLHFVQPEEQQIQKAIQGGLSRENCI